MIISYLRPDDGGMSFCHVNPMARLATPADDPNAKPVPARILAANNAEFVFCESDDAFYARMVLKIIPQGASEISLVSVDTVRASKKYRSYQSAMRIQENGSIGFDMNVARDIHRSIIRKCREDAMKSLDVQFIRAVEDGVEASEIVARKKMWRDAPSNPDIDSAQTIEALINIIPKETK